MSANYQNLESQILGLPRILKEPAGPVCVHLFQQSIDTGEIPKERSFASICPLFKKSDRSLACNYRAVSLTCITCKLLEHIVGIISNSRLPWWKWANPRNVTYLHVDIICGPTTCIRLRSANTVRFQRKCLRFKEYQTECQTR